MEQWPTQHRPYPPPDSPWMMFQRWHDLLFAHWAVPHEVLRAVVPASLPLDTFDDQAWLGITPFHITGLRPRLIPVPLLSEFPEINVRTYVTIGGKPGIYFFSLDAGSSVAVAAARALFGLPYYTADMAVEKEGAGIRYRSDRTDKRRPGAHFAASYSPTGDVFHAERGSLEYFLTERYCLYNVYEGVVYRAEIHHGPWPLQRAEAQITRNSMPEPAGLVVPDSAPLLHFAREQPTVVWPLEEVTAQAG